MKLIGMSKT